MPGFDNNVMFANNVDFTGGSPVQSRVTSDGQLLIGSTAAPNIRVGTLSSTGGTIAITNGNGTINLEAASSSNTVFSTASFVDDFHTSLFTTSLSTAVATIGDTNWRIALGTNGYIDAVREDGHPGIVSLGTSTTATAHTYITKDMPSLGGITVGYGQITIEFLIRLLNLSTGSERYTTRLGLGSSGPGNADQANGIYFEYTDTLNSGNWVGKTANTSTRSSANSANAVTTGWTRLKIIVNAAGTSVGFYVNGTQIANSPLTTNIPTGSITPFVFIGKSIGTTLRELYVDLITFEYALTTPR